MLKNFVVFTSFFFILYCSVNAQNIENEKKYKLGKNLIAPGLLIIGGIAVELSDGYLGRDNLQTVIRSGNPNFSTTTDDYLQYVPIVQIYTANLVGIKGKNSLFNQTKYLVIAELSTSLITHLLKNTLNVQRPNGGEHSFPSGHTSQAFSGASVLFMEYNQTSPVLAYSGLAVASGVGVLRVLNNKHRVSDVLAGAGIATGITALVYYFKPLENWNPFGKKAKNVSFICSENTAGISINF